MSSFNGYNTIKNSLLINTTIDDLLIANSGASIGSSNRPFNRVFSRSICTKYGELLVNDVEGLEGISIGNNNGIAKLSLALNGDFAFDDGYLHWLLK